VRYDGTNNQELFDFIESKPGNVDRNTRIIETGEYSGVIFNNIGAINSIGTVFSPSRVDFDEATGTFVITPEARA